MTGSRSSLRRRRARSCSSSRATCGRRRITATGRTPTSRRTPRRSGSAVPHALAAGADARGSGSSITPLDVPARQPATRARCGSRSASRPGRRVPPIGLGMDGDGHALDRRARSELLRALGPAHLRVELRLDGDDWRDALAPRAGDGARRRQRTRAVAAPASPSTPTTARRARGGARRQARRSTRVLVVLAGGRTATPEETTPPELVDSCAARSRSTAPGAAFVGGTEIYFTEINRTRPQLDDWDGVCYSHHAADPRVHRSRPRREPRRAGARPSAARGRSRRASPSSSRRSRSGGASTSTRRPTRRPTPRPASCPTRSTSRQSSLLGAAWTAGSLKYSARRAPRR